MKDEASPPGDQDRRTSGFAPGMTRLAADPPGGGRYPSQTVNRLTSEAEELTAILATIIRKRKADR